MNSLAIIIPAMPQPTPKQVKRAIERTGMTHADLAERLGVSKSVVSKWAGGEEHYRQISGPAWHLLRMLARMHPEYELRERPLKALASEDLKCPHCGSHAVFEDKEDSAKWHYEDQGANNPYGAGLVIEVPMICHDCSAVLVLTTVATALDSADIEREELEP